MSLADWTGWIAAAAKGTAAVVPLAQRVLHRRRADLGSGSVRLHVTFFLSKKRRRHTGE